MLGLARNCKYKLTNCKYMGWHCSQWLPFVLFDNFWAVEIRNIVVGVDSYQDGGYVCLKQKPLTGILHLTINHTNHLNWKKARIFSFIAPPPPPHTNTCAKASQICTVKKANKHPKKGHFTMEWPISHQKNIQKVESSRKKLISDMIKLHERIPIDRQAQGFRTYLY